MPTLPLRIDAVDFFYLSMPEVLDIGDGSQDALLVRVHAGGLVGWGECEAAPLPSIASWCCPMSHSACKPVAAGVIGQTLAGPEDIPRIGRLVRAGSFDLLQADHTLSGIDMALWDLLGKALEQPAWRLVGYSRAYRKTPYASLLFGASPHHTFEAVRRVVQAGYRAVKLGWGPYGKGEVAEDRDQVMAAREAAGGEAVLMVDAGTAFGEDVAAARARLDALAAARVHWFEEPFESGALSAYAELAADGRVSLAGGEECHTAHQAMHMIDHARVRFIQIDTGRIGGITPAVRVARHAARSGVTYVNHTFTTHLALAASIVPYAGLDTHVLCEYPVEQKPLARDLCTTRLERDPGGDLLLPDAPGLGIEPDLEVVRRYLLDVEIRVGDRVLYRTPAL